MSTIDYDKIVGRSRAANRYQVSTVDDIDERRKRKQENADDKLVAKLVAEVGKKTAVLTPLNLGKVALKSSNVQQAKEMGIPASQANKLDDVADTSILATTLAPALAGLTALNQIRRSKMTEDLANKQSDYYKKALMMGRQGQSFNSMAPGMAAMTTKNMMNASLNFGGMMSMYELLTKHKLTGLSTEPLSYGNPGLIAAKMFGGIPGLGNAMVGGAGHAINGVGHLTGLHGLNSVGGDLVKTAAGFNPGVASILSLEGILGGMGTVGIGIGANKLLQHVINNSVLNTSKTTRNKWNQQRYQFPSDANHQAIQQYSMALANIKTNLSTGSITSGEAQNLAALEKIVYNTALISNIYSHISDQNRIRKNRGVETMNYVDKNIKDLDMSGKDLGNIFDGRMNSAQRAFFSTIGFLNSAVGSTNIISNLFKSFKGQATDESFWALREAKQGYDKDAPLKQLGRDIGQGLSTTRLLYATNLKTLIGDSRDPGLTAAVTSAMLLQIIAQKSVTQKNMLGELHRLEEAQDRKIEAKQNWFIDTIVKGVDKTLQKTPIIGALMPLVHTAVGIGKFAKSIYNFADDLTNPKYTKGFTGFFGDIRRSVVDSLRNDNIKSEETIRARLKITKKTKQDLVNDYFAGHFQNQMQELLELLGSQNERLYQDQYTGDFLTHDQAEKLRKGRARKLNAAMGQFNNPDGMMGIASNWVKKTLFGVSKETLRESAMKLKHVKGLVDEFGNPIAKNLSSSGGLSGNINSWNYNSFTGTTQTMLKGIGILALASYKLFAGYLPYLKQIADCCPEKKNKLKNAGGRGIGEGLIIDISSSTRGTNYNTQDLINQNQQEDRASKFFNTFFEHIPNITKILELMQHKDVKSGMIEDKSKTDPSSGGGLFGWLSDFFGDGKKGPGKGRWSRFKDWSKEKYQKGKEKSSAGWTKAKEYGAKGWEAAKYGAKTTWRGAQIVGSLGAQAAVSGARTGGALLAAGGAGLARVGAGLVGVLGSVIGGVGALPAIAIGTVLAGLADFMFNDGKMTKAIWSSITESDFGKAISESFETMKKGWDNLKTWISDGIDNIITNISDSISGAFAGIKIAIYKGMSNIPGLESYMNAKIKEEESSSAANIAQRNDAKRQESDIKEMQQKIKDAKSENERLQIALSYKDRVSGAASQEAIDDIINAKIKSQESTFGTGMTWQGMKDQLAGFSNMDPNKRDEMIRGYSELKSLKESSGKMTAEDKASYQQVDEMIRKIKEDMRKEYEAKNPVNKEKEQAALNESLKQMQDTNNLLLGQIQTIVAQSSTVNGAMLKGFSEQMQVLSGNQNNLSTIMNSTARLMQKPNTVVLDTTVAKLIPAIN